MDLGQTDWERLEADKRILKEYVLVKHWVVESRLYNHMIRFESR